MTAIGVQNNIILDVLDERRRQVELWGDQRHPYSNILVSEHRSLAASWRRVNDKADVPVTWFGILSEEVHESFAETDVKARRKEAVEAMAVLMAMVEQMDEDTP